MQDMQSIYHNLNNVTSGEMLKHILLMTKTMMNIAQLSRNWIFSTTMISIKSSLQNTICTFSMQVTVLLFFLLQALKPLLLKWWQMQSNNGVYWSVCHMLPPQFLYLLGQKAKQDQEANLKMRTQTSFTRCNSTHWQEIMPMQTSGRSNSFCWKILKDC